MHSFLQGLLLLSSIAIQAYGLKCWTCNNSKGAKDCMRRGRLRKCKENEQMCFSELRNVDGFWQITKRCKEDQACQNNFIQNPRDASITSQCNPFLHGSVCRCCCNTDACNQHGLQCLERDPECPFVPKPVHGFTKCQFNSSALEVGSTCRFSCEKGYELVGSTEATCNNVEGSTPTFEPATPTCQPNQCKPELGDIPNGQVSCSNGAGIGSICVYTCGARHAISGSESVVCEASGKWSSHPPSCNPLRCSEQRPPVNGAMTCNNAGLVVGTACSFTCDDGYALEGREDNMCIEAFPGFAEWSESPPVCDPIICLPTHTAPENGVVSCSNGNYLGSDCTFTCDEGFELLGTPQSQCVDLEAIGPLGSWTSEAPTCVEKEADAIPCPEEASDLAHGRVDCSDGSSPGSQCDFHCDDGFAVDGSETTVCLDDGTWSDPVPICMPTSCGAIEDINNGTVSCTDGVNIESTCTFQCEGTDLQLHPNTVEGNTCVINEDGTAGWFPPTPCCTLPCPPYILMDFVIVLDSSSSVKLPNWEIQIKFTSALIERFHLGPNSARMSIFRYNSHVDEDSEIKLNDVLDGDMDRFVSLFKKIPYNGSGTKTGEALVHAQTKSLSAAYGNRPGVKDVVLVITDGKAEDTKLVKDVSEEMRASGVMIFAVGIGVNDVVYQRLTKMTGSEERTVRANNFDELLSGGLPEKLGATLCKDPCFKS